MPACQLCSRFRPRELNARSSILLTPLHVCTYTCACECICANRWLCMCALCQCLCRLAWRYVLPVDACASGCVTTVTVKDAMNYFRAILKSGEISQRALDLTTAVVDLNAANYAAWYLSPNAYAKTARSAVIIHATYTQPAHRTDYSLAAPSCDHCTGFMDSYFHCYSVSCLSIHLHPTPSNCLPTSSTCCYGCG